jgi:hypothetical protein
VVYKLNEEMRIYLWTAFEFHLPSCLIYGSEKPKVVAWVAAPMRKLWLLQNFGSMPKNLKIGRQHQLNVING